MSTFDAEVFAASAFAGVTEIINAALQPSTEAVVALKDMCADVEATLAAIEIERDGRRAQALRDDLGRFLPGRSEQILQLARRDLSPVQAKKIEAELAVATRAANLVARAFVTALS